jgi:hypothetical protein
VAIWRREAEVVVLEKRSTLRHSGAFWWSAAAHRSGFRQIGQLFFSEIRITPL